MKQFFDKLVKETVEGKKILYKAEEKKSELMQKYSKQIIGQAYYDDEMKKAEELRKELISEYFNKMDKTANEFIAYQEEKYGVNGSEVTEDIALLNGAFVLTQSDIDRLSEKYHDNYTMLNAIERYAKIHDLNFQSLIRKEEENKAFQYLHEYCRSCFTSKDDVYIENLEKMYDKCCMMAGLENNHDER